MHETALFHPDNMLVSRWKLLHRLIILVIAKHLYYSLHCKKVIRCFRMQVHETALFHPDNMLVCAPTGAGKTNVALLTMLHEIGLHRREDGSFALDEFKIIYLAPMKVPPSS